MTTREWRSVWAQFLSDKFANCARLSPMIFLSAATKNSVRWVHSVSRLGRKMLRSLVLMLVFAGAALATDLKITDASHTVIVVHEAFIDYGGLVSDKEGEGIRIYQGQALVTAKWMNVKSVTITGQDTSTPEARLTADIVPRKGTKITTTLVNKGRMRLAGKTDLGDYAIDLEKVLVIEPVLQ